MKRIVMYATCFVLVIFLFGCASTPKSTVEVDNQGNEVTTSDSGMSVTLAQLPYTMQYNDLEIPFVSAEVYMGYGDDHGKTTYLPYLVLTFDRSSLSDDDIYWLTQDDTFDTEGTITDEANGLERKDMMIIRTFYDEAHLYRVLTMIGLSYDTYYSNFADIPIQISIAIKQDKTVEIPSRENNGKDKKDITLNMENRYFYDVTIPNDAPDIEGLAGTPLYNQINQGVLALSNAYTNALS